MSKITGILICLLLCSFPAHARNYAIELIVFQRMNTESKADQKIDFSSDRIVQKRLHMEQLKAKSKTITTSNQLHKLSSVQKKLTKSGFRILKTARWNQQSQVYQRAPLVSIGDLNSPLSAGFVRVYKTSLIFVDVDLQLTPQLFTSSTLAPTFVSTENPSPGVEVNPESALEVGNSGAPLLPPLHSQIHQVAEETTLPSEQQPYFFISEKRRLKFKQIHYFDHPEFGVILGVWPG
ncbi:MAG: hypothetical protein GKR96_01660 [Gammaproteobacteria bacterium]|nr:hypothetical protein [Gammaproteobacteria bacterium]